MTSQDILSLATRLVALGERQHRTLEAAYLIIAEVLESFSTSYRVEPIATTVPLWKKAELRLDGRTVPAKPTGLVSGSITGKDSIVSSLIGSQYLLDYPNINVNPRSSEISQGNFYFAPSFAVNHATIKDILKATKVSGRLVVRKQSRQAKQVLVGNLRSPSRIIFTHYDSIGPGAIDNASGVAVALGAIARCPAILESSLFVIDPNEELSYDRPTYWGHGYRMFERKHRRILESCKRIYSLDCVGNGPPAVAQDAEVTRLAVPLKHSSDWEHKTYHFFGDIPKLMAVYHSDGDTADGLSARYLGQTAELLRSELLK